MNIFEIIKALQNTSSVNEKLKIMKANKDDDFLKVILKYTYDRITYTYGVTSHSITRMHLEEAEEILAKNNVKAVPQVFTLLEKLSNRELTGNLAVACCVKLYSSAPREEAQLFINIIDRDLKIGLADKTLNKVWKGLIPKPNYNRCGVYSSKLAQKFTFPAYLQLKCDGTYREVLVKDGKVTMKTRAGEIVENPVVAEQMKNFPNGYYTGEFTIGQALVAMNRSEANGLINSDNPPYERIIFTIWDFLSEDDYSGKDPSLYIYRFNALKSYLSLHEHKNIALVPCWIVHNIEEVLEKTSTIMQHGLEGAVLKDMGMIFKNGTNQQQLKIKLKVDCEMRIKGFTEGTGKREGYVGAIIFENDEKTIRGQCSGFSEAQMIEFTNDKAKFIDKIITVEFNDLTKSDSNDYYALMHPRFIEIRNDKNETDTLSKVIELRDMAKNI